MQRKAEGISLTTHYQFQQFYRHLNICQVTTADGLPVHIASEPTRTENAWFPSTSR